jgi:hypothetical protein
VVYNAISGLVSVNSQTGKPCGTVSVFLASDIKYKKGSSKSKYKSKLSKKEPFFSTVLKAILGYLPALTTNTHHGLLPPV